VSAPQLKASGQAGPGAAAPQGTRERIRALLAELFPEPAGRTQLGARARSALILLQILIIAVGAAVMIVRVAGRPAWDSVYAEDPGLYLPQALAHPWHLLQSYGGYLQLVSRVIAQIAALVPLRYASVVFAASGALIASACGLFTYHASAGLVSSRWLRALLGLSVVLLPVAQLEVADNTVNSIWYLLIALFWAALWRPRTRSGAWVAAVVAFAAAASTSLGLVFAPLFAARAITVPRRLREHAATVGWALGCLLQVLVIVTSHRSRLRPHNPLNAPRYYLHDVLLPALGWHVSWHLRDIAGLNGATVIVGGFLAVVLVAVLVTQSTRSRVFVVTAVVTGIVLAGLCAVLAWGGPGLAITIAVEHGARYATVPILLLDAALIVAADGYARRWWPRPRAVVAVAALVAILGVGWVSDFRYPVRRLSGPGSDWVLTADAWLRHCRQDPAGSITVSFPNWWGTGTLANTFSCASLHR
jgi:hypothetical protein